MEGGLHISFAPEHLFTLWGMPVPNTLMAAWMVIVVLGLVGFMVGRSPRMVPLKLQNMFEMLFEFVLNFMEQTLGSRKLAVQYFPLIATIFLFIFTSNLFDFLPFFGSVGIHHGEEFIPLFHAVNTDLNATLALAIIAVFSTQIAGILALGVWRYAGKFFNFKSPLSFFVGIIEFISELSRFVSFSFRLFGNIFAGEVLLSVVGFFMPYAAPVPLMVFELFVGFIQAAVFAMLTLVFIKLAVAMPHGDSHAHAPARANAH